MTHEEYEKQLKMEPYTMTPDERLEQAKMLVKFKNQYQAGQRFIIDNQDKICGRYYCAGGFFLIASAICDRFDVNYCKNIYHETEYIDPYVVIKYYSDIYPETAVKMWAWAINEFGSYFDYDFMPFVSFEDKKRLNARLYEDIVSQFCKLNSDFLKAVMDECDNSNSFLSVIVESDKKYNSIVYILSLAIKNKKYLLCKAIFEQISKLVIDDETKKDYVTFTLEKATKMMADYESMEALDLIIDALIPDAKSKFKIENDDIISFAKEKRAKLQAKFDAIEEQKRKEEERKKLEEQRKIEREEKKKLEEQRKKENEENELKRQKEVDEWWKKQKRKAIICVAVVVLIFILGKISSIVVPKALVKNDIVKVYEEYGAENVDISFDLKANNTYCITAKIDKLPKLSNSNVDEINTKIRTVCYERSTSKCKFEISDVEVEEKISDGIYFDTDTIYSSNRKFETTTEATTTKHYNYNTGGGINYDAIKDAQGTTKYRKRYYNTTTKKDRYNAKKYGNAEDFYDDNYDDFDSYEDAEDYYDDYD